MNEPIAGKPDNGRLLKLLNEYAKAGDSGKTAGGQTISGQAHKDVVLELLDGDAFLMFPIAHPVGTGADGMFKPAVDTDLVITSAVSQNGLKVLGTFTDEQSLRQWAKNQDAPLPGAFTSMRSQDVLQFFWDNQFDRMVIDSGAANVFVLDVDRGKIPRTSIPAGTQIELETVKHPPAKETMSALVAAFDKMGIIEEVYLYGLTLEDTFGLVLGVRLTEYTPENCKMVGEGVLKTMQDTHPNGKPAEPIDLFFLKSEDWYENVKKIDHSLIYKRPDQFAC